MSFKFWLNIFTMLYKYFFMLFNNLAVVLQHTPSFVAEVRIDPCLLEDQPNSHKTEQLRWFGWSEVWSFTKPAMAGDNLLVSSPCKGDALWQEATAALSKSILHWLVQCVIGLGGGGWGDCEHIDTCELLLWAMKANGYNALLMSCKVMVKPMVTCLKPLLREL